MRLPSIHKLDALAPLDMSGHPTQALTFADFAILQKVIQSTYQSARLAIKRIEDLPNHLYQVCVLHLSDGSHAVLKINPPAVTPLLKLERPGLESEAFSLMVLGKSGLPIPSILRAETSSAVLGSPFLIVNRLPGLPLARLLPHLSRTDRISIDRQIQKFESTIAQYMSPAFGPVGLVSKGQGFKSWREAYKSMMGSVLKDGEDMFVNLPYSYIREQVVRTEHVLDEVLEARLVVLGLGNADNVLVDERTKDVTGLLDFKEALWGDTDMGTGLASTSVRGLLYICYHAIVVIVSCYYRTLRDGAELDARRRLTVALAQLVASNS